MRDFKPTTSGLRGKECADADKQAPSSRMKIKSPIETAREAPSDAPVPRGPVESSNLNIKEGNDNEACRRPLTQIELNLVQIES